jgi:hypothetical protein
MSIRDYLRDFTFKAYSTHVVGLLFTNYLSQVEQRLFAFVSFPINSKRSSRIYPKVIFAYSALVVCAYYSQIRARVGISRACVNSKQASDESSISDKHGPPSKPTVDRSEKLASIIQLALVAPEPRHAHGGAEFPSLSTLMLRKTDCLVK